MSDDRRCPTMLAFRPNRLRPTLALCALLAACGAPPSPPAPVQARRAPPGLPILPASLPDDCKPLEVELPDLVSGPQDPPVPPIVGTHVLSPFFERAARVLRGRARDHVRIAMYGDSNLTRDFVSGHMRRWLHEQYGDAGHGFVALIRPWGNYEHMDVRHRALGGGWLAFNSSTNPVLDQRVGIGGIAAESLFRGAKTWVATADGSSPIGQRVSRADVFFLKGKHYGRFDVEIDGTVEGTVDTHAEQVELGIHRIELEDGPHEIRLIAGDHMRRTRLLGIVLERDERPSFVIDSLGVGGINTLSQARQNPEINKAMLGARAYDLVIFATGANDPFTIDRVPGALAKVVALQREALPGVPMLMLTPADRGKWRSFPGTMKIVEQREEFARAHGTAFWNLFQAMGAPNVMLAWRRRGFAIEDYIHYSKAGGAHVGDRLLYALWRELAAYLREHPRAGCNAPTVEAFVAQGPDASGPKTGGASSAR